MTDSTTLYTVTVPYEWGTCCRMGDDEATLDIRAESPEEAKGLAKNALESTPYVHKTYDATIKHENMTGYNMERMQTVYDAIIAARQRLEHDHGIVEDPLVFMHPDDFSELVGDCGHPTPDPAGQVIEQSEIATIKQSIEVPEGSVSVRATGKCCPKAFAIERLEDHQS